MLTADAPTQHLAAVPVHHRHQVDKPIGQADVGDVSAPDLVGPGDLKATQQVRVNRVLWVCPTGVGARCHALQAHLAHQALQALAIDPITHRLADHDHHAPGTVKRMSGVFFIDQAA